MGRNRRAAQQEAEAAAPTLDATLVIARSDVLAVLERLPELWEDLYAPVPRPRADAAQEHKPRDTAIVSPALWTGTTRVQGVYLDVIAELARAHWALGQDTDVPMYWRWLYDCNHDPETKAPLLTGPRAHTVELPELVKWTRVLDHSLEWLQWQDDLRPPEVNAIMEAAGHIRSARERIDKLFAPKIEKRRCIMPDCEGGDGKPRVVRRDNGKVCDACMKADYRARKKAEKERREKLAEERRGLRKAS